MANDIVSFLRRFKKTLADDASLYQIFDLFILPLIKQSFKRPIRGTRKSFDGKYRQEYFSASFDDLRGEDFRTSMDQLFSVDSRSIDWYEVIDKFTLKGDFVEGPCRIIPGYNPEHLRQGQQILVRMDKALPYIEVQVDKSREQFLNDYVYRLTKKQFAHIRKYIRRV